jgi:hypothetical protein
MSRKRLADYVILLSYLAVTVAAFLYTTLRIQIPFLPWSLVHWSYGMMAPYQGELSVNGDLRAEGEEPDGTWQPIDLAPYFPVGFGERNVRMYLRTFRGDGDEAYRAKYGELAQRVMALEAERGRLHRAVRLWWDTWPRSVDGFSALRRAPYISSELILTVP